MFLTLGASDVAYASDLVTYFILYTFLSSDSTEYFKSNFSVSSFYEQSRLSGLRHSGVKTIVF